MCKNYSKSLHLSTTLIVSLFMVQESESSLDVKSWLTICQGVMVKLLARPAVLWSSLKWYRQASVPHWLLAEYLSPLPCRSLHRAPHNMAAGFPQSK